MKTGDLVHVPADVTLMRNVNGDMDILSVRHFKTKVPKKALFIRTLDHNSCYCLIEYGENMWTVHTSNITLLED